MKALGFGALSDWVQEQAKYALFIGLIVVLIVTAFKRAWIAMIGAFVGLAFVSIFIVNPDMIIKIGHWISNMLSLGRR